MPLGSILIWIANHIGLGSVKTATGIRSDLVNTKKAKLEIKKLDVEVNPPLVQPATFQDVKDFDPKVAKIQKGILNQILPLIWQFIILLLILFALMMFTFNSVSFRWIKIAQPVQQPIPPRR